MNKTFKYIGSVLMMALAMTACSPDEFDSPNQANIPSVGQADVSVEVDQTTNQVTLTMNNKACYPLWYIPNGAKTVYSTVNGLKRIFATAGDYQVKYQIGNANGVSLGMDSVSFTIDNTIFNFDQYFNLMAGGSEGSGSSKQWRIDNSVAQHLGCGPSGTTGLDWYSAQPDEKAGTGLYDCTLTFTTEKEYTLDPGSVGSIFVNTGCTIFPEYHQDADFSVPVEAQTVSFDFDVEGDNLYISLPAHTLFPYIANDAQYNAPVRFLIESLTPKQMVLVYDNGEIAWHFILTSGERETGFQGFDPDNDCNMWKTCQFTMSYWYAPGWSQIDDPTMTADGNAYTFSLPQATTDQWQAQTFFNTDMATNSATTYDFSCILVCNTDHPGVTLKLQKDADNFYFAERVSLKAYEEYIFYMSDMPGIDIEGVTLCMDFGGNAEGAQVTVKSIVLKEHGCDDGTKLPVADEFNGYNAASDCNMWKSMQYTTSYWYAPGWSQIDDPELTADGNSYTFSLPMSTTDQWQAQAFLNTDMATNAATRYDFSCVLVSNSDHPGVTLKLQKDADNFYFAERVSLKAYEEYIFYMSDMEGIDIDAVTLCLDFGGNAENAQVTIKDVVLKEHDCDDGAGQPGAGPAQEEDVMDWDWTSANNLWKSVYDSHLAPAFWYAPGWAQIGDPDFTQDDDVYTVMLPEATTDQWMAQMHFDTDISALAADTYNFYCVLYSDKDHPGVTVKLTQNGDDNNFFFADRVALTAYEEYVFKKKNVQLPADAEQLNLFFDFGGNAAGNTIQISKVYLEKVQ